MATPCRYSTMPDYAPVIRAMRLSFFIIHISVDDDTPSHMREIFIFPNEAKNCIWLP